MFSIQSDGKSINPTYVTLLKGRRAIFPVDALIAAYGIFPRSNIITRQVLLKSAWQAAFPGMCTWQDIRKNVNGRGGLQLVTFLRLLLTLLDLASTGGQYWAHHSEYEAQCPLNRRYTTTVGQFKNTIVVLIHIKYNSHSQLDKSSFEND